MLHPFRFTTNISEAATLIPATIETNGAFPEDVIRTLMAASWKASGKVQERLRSLDSMNRARRRDAWEAGPESKWFLDYGPLKFRSLRANFQRVSRILTEKRLKIICDTSSSNWGDAWPAIRKIKLGMMWISSASRLERIQTFIHEASHIAGRTVVKEDKWYGREDARKMAHETRNTPMQVMRSADNLGYYALDVAFG